MSVFKYDMHVHTSEVSVCGRTRAKEVVKMYKNAGYQGLVITDHFNKEYFDKFNNLDWGEKIDRYLKGYYEAYDEGQKYDMDILLGMEIRFPQNVNDYLVYGVSEKFLKENEDMHNTDINFFKQLIKNNENIMIYQAHPFREKCVVADWNLLDGVEAYNGNPRHDSLNHKAMNYASEHKLLMISGSDFHRTEDLASGGIIVNNRMKNQDDLINALRTFNYDNLIMNN